jgi:hypothetical protein
VQRRREEIIEKLNGPITDEESKKLLDELYEIDKNHATSAQIPTGADKEFSKTSTRTTPLGPVKLEEKTEIEGSIKYDELGNVKSIDGKVEGSVTFSNEKGETFKFGGGVQGGVNTETGDAGINVHGNMEISTKDSKGGQYTVVGEYGKEAGQAPDSDSDCKTSSAGPVEMYECEDGTQGYSVEIGDFSVGVEYSPPPKSSPENGNSGGGKK